MDDDDRDGAWREHIAEGPQLLRYNTTAAYIPHLDYMEDLTGRRQYNFDSAGTGSNRYATILFYLNDVEAGGETIFTKAAHDDGESSVPPEMTSESSESSSSHLQEAIIRDLRAASPEIVLEHGSWQENMTATCRSRGFAVKPVQNRAILFYNQVRRKLGYCHRCVDFAVLCERMNH
jgi:2OG-Fe(II) oxygenase superfamily